MIKKTRSLAEIKSIIREDESFTNSGLSTLFIALTIYVCYQTVFLAGKIYMPAAYFCKFQYEADYTNIQFFCFFGFAPLGVYLVSHFILILKFRFILWVGSLGSILFFIAPLQTALCYKQQVSICDIDFIYSLGIVISALSGILHSILVFGFFFYFSSISKKQEKPLMYCAFFLAHNFTWMLGSTLGEMFVELFSFQLQTYFETILILEFIISFSFCFILDGGDSSKINRFLNLKKQSSKQSKLKNREKNKNQDEEKEDEGKLEDNLRNQANLINLSISQLSVITLQYFSLENSELEQLDENQIIDKLEFQNYGNNSFFKNLYLTLNRMNLKNFIYIIPLILNVSFVETFEFLGLYTFYNQDNLELYKDIDDNLICQSETYHNLVQKGFTVFFYLGIGEMFGCFTISMIGDKKEKIRGLLLILFIEQIALLIAWAEIQWNYFATLCIFITLLGFSHSALQQTIVNLLIFEFPQLIYMIDLIYSIYSFGQALSSIFLILTNYGSVYPSIIFMQTLGLFSIISLCIYIHKLKKKQNEEDSSLL